MKTAFFIGLIVIRFCIEPLTAKAQTGGTFDLTHNVIAGGGGSSSVGGPFSVDGTVGQHIAGAVSTGGGFNLRGGFWAFGALAPTAAAVSISGQIRTANGVGIRSSRLVLTNGATGETVTAVSSSFGYYRFSEIAVGQFYILAITSKRFAFEPDTRSITLFDDLSNEDFVALPE